MIARLEATQRTKITRHVSRITFHVSRITFHVSLLTFHASRFTYHASVNYVIGNRNQRADETVRRADRG